MATSIPGKKAPASAPLALSYAEKLETSTILALPPARLASLFAAGAPGNNRVVLGDNLGVLLALARRPERFRLVYIDPPYASGGRFETRAQEHAYDDLLEGAAYIEYLRRRLVVLRELLSDDGSIYVHVDDRALFPLKLVMDEVFGAENFRNLIVRKKCNPKNYTRRQYGNVADYLLYFSKGPDPVWNQPFEAWTEAGALREYAHVEPATGRRFKKVPLHAPGERKGATGQPWRGKLPPPGKHWQYPPAELDALDARGEIAWSATGNPRRKVYLDRSKGVPVQDVWLDFKDAHNQNVRVTGYPTEKNPALLARIIAASSNPGDRVLDAFGGSGTTACVAEQLGRQWVTIDCSPVAVDATLARLAGGRARMGDFVTVRDGGPREAELASGFELWMAEEAAPVAAEQLEAWRGLFDGR